MKTYPIEVGLTIERDSLSYALAVSGNYFPGRPAPHCCNHDSPAFSDPGDSPEFDIAKIVVEEVLDEEGSIVCEAHPLFSKILKGDQIELTSKEEEGLYDAIAHLPADDRYDGPDRYEDY